MYQMRTELNLKCLPKELGSVPMSFLSGDGHLTSLGQCILMEQI